MRKILKGYLLKNHYLVVTYLVAVFLNSILFKIKIKYNINQRDNHQINQLRYANDGEVREFRIRKSQYSFSRRNTDQWHFRPPRHFRSIVRAKNFLRLEQMKIGRG